MGGGGEAGMGGGEAGMGGAVGRGEGKDYARPMSS